MILDEVVLHNFGLYAERQTITLTPPSQEKPVVLLGGLNGAGKTTLIDAILLCLYGPFAKIADRKNLSYQDYLKGSIHRSAIAREAAIEIAFRSTVDGRQNSYRIHRSWRVRGSGCVEHFEVSKNDQLDVALAGNWINQVEDLIPPNIAHLFFFDGEQIEGYASQENSRQLIGTAIHNLLGLDIVDQLDKDLQTFERRKRMEDSDDAGREDVERAETAIEQIRSRVANLKQDRAGLRTHKLDRKNKQFAQAEEQYRKLGGELFEQKAEIERRKCEAEATLGRGETRLRDIAAGDLPLAIARDLLRSVERRDGEEEASRREKEVARVLEDRDAHLLEVLSSSGASAKARRALEAYLDEDRSRRAAQGERETVLDLSAEARSALHNLLGRRLETLIGEAGTALDEHAMAAAEREHVALEHASIPEPDTIAELAATRDGLREEIAGIQAQIAAMDSELARAMREEERLQQALARLLESHGRAENARQDRQRFLHHSDRVRGTLEKFRAEVIAQHVHRIERLVLESYHHVLRKSALVTGLSIDPASFALTLFGRDGKALGPERLSAGERQLLAIALLWGLARASGRPLPTAIDTPLGRLDKSHRMHLVERYFPFASHQVLLLSTDEEITGAYLDRLKPYIGRSYQLVYDDARGITTVEPGYFREVEAA